MYNAAIQEALSFRALTEDSVIEMPTVTYKGTTYRMRLTVVLDFNESGYVLDKVDSNNC